MKEEQAKENQKRGQEMMAKMMAKRGETAEKKREEFQTPAKPKDPMANIQDILNKTKK